MRPQSVGGPTRRIAALACLILLLGPSALAMPLEPSYAAPAEAIPPSSSTSGIPEAYVPLVKDWLDGRARAPPSDPAALLASMIPASALPVPPATTQSWNAFFSAFGENPTPAERQALAAFEVEHPHVAQQVRALASDVARAQRLREEAFSATTDADWALLPSAAVLLASGRADDLTAEQARAVSTVDLVKLAQGAHLLVRAATAAPDALRAADAQDQRMRGTIPAGLLSPSTMRTPSSVLSSVAGEPPVQAGVSFAAALQALQLAAGLPIDTSASSVLPSDLDAPLANILAAAARQAQLPDEKSGRATLATIGDELSPLVRAAVNLSIATPGQLDSTGGAARPLASVPLAKDAGRALDLAFQDGFGASGHAPSSSLPAGMAELAAALGAPVSDEQRADIMALEARLGPELAGQIGSVLAAQAAYERDLGPGAPAPTRASRSWSAALPILGSDAPLTVSDLGVLQEAVDAVGALRELEGERAADLAASLLGVRTTQSSTPVPIPGSHGAVLFDNFGILVADESDATWSAQEYSSGRTLFIDLGGNDTYTMPVASVSSPGLGRTSVSIDLGGDDTYESKFSYSLGAALGSSTAPTFAMLLDASGNDKYEASAEPAMGWGRDGYGLLVDLKGDDRYHSSGIALGGANTSSPTASAMGLVVDVYGNDGYSASQGLAYLEDNASSSATIAGLIELSGSDTYAKKCVGKGTDPCFALPRTSNLTNKAQGAVVFFDGGGANTYPRSLDPSNDPQFDSNGKPTDKPMGQPQFDADGRRFFFAMDATQYENFTVMSAYSLGGAGSSGTGVSAPPPVDAPDPVDRDGNGIPDFVENPRGRSDHVTLDNLLLDSDGDSFPDGMEWALGTDPHDADSYPIGVPAPPAPVPDPTGTLPTGLRARRDGFFLNLPPVLAIGLPGSTNYSGTYLLTIDLGVGDDNLDSHPNGTAANGFSVSLGGATRYQPTSPSGAGSRSLAAVFPAKGVDYHSDGAEVSGSDNAASATNVAGTFDQPCTGIPNIKCNPDSRLTGAAGVAALIDLGGDDVYVTSEGSLASVTSSEGLAVLLDAAGSDRYTADGGASMGYADAGGDAYFFDLAGDDRYTSPTQGIVDSSIYPGGVGVFVDAAGKDLYDAGQRKEIARKDYDAYQGQVLHLNENLGSAPRAVHDVPALSGGPQAIAAFVDLDGSDTYVVRDPLTHLVVDLTGMKQDRLRISPVDDNAYGRASLFFDTGVGSEGLSDSDGSGGEDVVEQVGGTDPHSSDDDAYDTSGSTAYFLHLPRLGIAVGSGEDTNYSANRSYALLLDLGGENNYSTRAGASSPRFPTSLAISLGSNDTYDFRGGDNLSDFSAFAITNASDTFVQDKFSANFTDAIYGGAQGAGVFGTGVLYAGSPMNVFRQVTRAHTCCNASAVVVGASQGAGVFGVGALILNSTTPGQPTVFESDVAAEVESPLPNIASIARNVAQGSSVGGIGIFANLHPGADDYYALNATATGGRADRASAGQGYGAQGVGILIDSGGDNTFLSAGLSQAAGDGAGVRRNAGSALSVDDLVSIPPPTGPLAVYNRSSVAAGIMLLPGVGRDTLTATNASQAYAVGAGIALLYDAEGDDAFTLTAPVASGQAAAFRGGTALLLNDKGNNAYRAGSNAQAFAAGSAATAMLVDLSGSDSYVAAGPAQAVVWNDTHAVRVLTSGAIAGPAGGFALLLDGAGSDLYQIPPKAQGHGGIPVGTAPTGSGASLFVDAAGCDRYLSSPPSSTSSQSLDPGATEPLPAHCTSRGVPRNNAQWSTPTGLYSGMGADTNAVGLAYATLFSNPSALGIANVTIGGRAPASVTWVQGDVTFFVNASLILAKSSLTKLPNPTDWIDRVEIYSDGALLGEAAFDATLSGYVFVWSTTLQGADLLPLAPDGEHKIDAWVFPHTSTSKRVDGVGETDDLGAHAAIDLQPFSSSLRVIVDNPPYAREPDLPAAILVQETGEGDFIDVPLFVDRDAERECNTASCIQNKPHFPVARSEWDPGLASPPDRSFDAGLDSACVYCKVRNLTAVNGSGKTYLWWEPKNASEDVEGYRVFRQIGNVATPIGFVHARSTVRLMNGTLANPSVGDKPVYYFLDPTPGGADAYRVGTVRSTGSGYVMINATATLDKQLRAGPATGLNVTGSQGGVYLTWHRADGATKYSVQRYSLAPYERSPCWMQVGIEPDTGASVLSHVALTDATSKDTPFAYRVLPYKPGATDQGNNACWTAQYATDASSTPPKYGGEILANNVTAMSTPGATVTLSLEKANDPSFHRDYEPFPLPGNQVGTLRTDVTGLPDGEYVVTVKAADGSPAETTTTRNVVLDRNPPSTSVLLPPYIGGAAALNGGLTIPFDAGDGEGSGVRWTYVYARLDEGDWSGQIRGDPAVGSVVFTQVQDGATVDVIAFSEDHVGHVEGANPGRPWTPTPQDAFEDLRDADVFTRAIIDVSPPFGRAQSVERYVRPGQPLAFELPITETGSGVASAQLLVGKDAVTLSSKNTRDFTGSWTGREPGTYQAIAIVTDYAGNVGVVEMGTITVDPYPPVVQGVSVQFGDGRIAGRPGDIARMRVSAADNLTPEGRLSITLDTSRVSSRALANLSYNKDEGAYTGTFVLDQVRNASVTLRVADAAGNAVTQSLVLAVDATMPSLFNVTVVPRPDGFAANWTTDVPTQGRVLYGKTPAVGDATPWDAAQKNHTVIVSGLQPDTDYYVKVDALTPAGTATRSDIIVIHTKQGLTLNVTPVLGFPVTSGASVVQVKVKDHLGNDVPDALVRATLRTPRGAEQVIATTKLSAANGTVRLPTDGYQDGAYTLEIVATSGLLSGNVTFQRFVIDRTPPTILFTLPRAVVPGRLLQANVTEAGAGVDVANASWVFTPDKGQALRCPVVLVGETITCRVPSLQTGDRVQVHVAVPDAAGNVGTFDGIATLARGPLEVSNVTVSTTDGFSHLRSSVGAVLWLDVSGVPADGIWADVSQLGGSSRAELREEAPGRYALRFQPSASVADGTKTILIEAQSATGSPFSTRALAVLDSTPPAAENVSTYVTTAFPSRADVTILSNEITQATLTLDDGDAPPTDKDLAKKHTIRVEGLRPGTLVSGSARLVDAAGNVAIVPVSVLTAKDVQPPGEVTALRAEDNGDGHVRVSWTGAKDNAGIEAYRVERALADGTVADLASTRLTALQDVAPTGVPVTYRVWAVDLGGNEGPTATVTVTSTAVSHLSQGAVDPPLGGPGVYTYRVHLTDSDARQPRVVALVDGVEHTMRPTVADCRGDCVFEVAVALGPTTLDGAHRYSFRAESPRGAVAFPAESSLPGPVVVSGAAPPDVATANAMFRMPNLGLVSYLACIAAASTIILLFGRRRFT